MSSFVLVDDDCLNCNKSGDEAGPCVILVEGGGPRRDAGETGLSFIELSNAGSPGEESSQLIAFGIPQLKKR